MKSFIFKSGPAHVLFGSGTIIELPALVREIGGNRPLVISTPEQSETAERIARTLGDLDVAYFRRATMHTPLDVTDEALRLVEARAIDIVIGIGGGSTIGLGKAIALRTEIPQIAVPTTYAGSEMTPIVGETSNGRKTTQKSMRVLPKAVIYDVDLTLGLPREMAATSGLNAIAHAIEGLYASDSNPIMRLVAEEGIRALADALPSIARPASDNPEARASALYGAWLCGMVLGNVGMALHHKLCHTLGGMFDLPHAQTHAIILPHAVAYNAPAIPDAMAALSRALKSDTPIKALTELSRVIGAPQALRDIGMPESGIAAATGEALQAAYWNPRPLTSEGIGGLLARAWNGDSPA